VTGISVFSVKAWYSLEYNKGVIREQVLGHLMSVFYNLIFLPYRYHELDNHACHQALKEPVTLCFYFAGLTL